MHLPSQTIYGQDSVTPQERIELTIRAAKLIRCLSELVDCRSRQVGRLVLQEMAPQLDELVKFLTAEGKPGGAG